MCVSWYTRRVCMKRHLVRVRVRVRARLRLRLRVRARVRVGARARVGHHWVHAPLAAYLQLLVPQWVVQHAKEYHQVRDRVPS